VRKRFCPDIGFGDGGAIFGHAAKGLFYAECPAAIERRESDPPKDSD